MEKMPKKKKQKSNRLRNVLVALIVISITASAIILVGNRMNANLIKEKLEAESYQNWLAENCECLERNRPYCGISGFELKGSLCINKYGNVSTTRILGCSLYGCLSEGNNVTWSNETNKWGPKLN